MVVAEDADLSVNFHITQSSEETNIDPSNNGFSFIKIHWASFLAVLVFIALVARCCYFRGRRQLCARHTEVLCHIVAGANRHSSSSPRMQSGAYPGHAPASDIATSDPFIFEPTRGAVSQPIVRYSAASAC